MRLAFQNLGGKCIFSSEWDSYAQKTYELNYGEVPFGDITKIDENIIPDHDILVASLVKPFSSQVDVVGLRIQEELYFFDVARIIRAKRPRAFF